MPPVTLSSSESSKTWTGPHEETCRQICSRLIELNPGYNVFIYWQSGSTLSSGQLRQGEFVQGNFNSKYGGFFSYKYEYSYFVFSEGTVVYSGSEKADRLCIAGSNYDKVGDEYRFQGTNRTKVHFSDWMGQLRNKLGARASQLYLSSLALPATHNSHALAGNIFTNHWYQSALKLFAGAQPFAASFATCQAYTVKEQLDMGVRSFDFRVGPGLELRHGKVELSGNLKEIVQFMSDWLELHNQETIMFQAKWDMKPYEDENRRNAAAEVDVLLRNFPRALVQKEQPRLSECIGKMVLFNDNGFGAWEVPSFGISITPSTASNEYARHTDNILRGLEFVSSQLDVENKLFYNIYCDKQGLDDLTWKTALPMAASVRPMDFAVGLKPSILRWLQEHRGGTQNQGRKARLGRISMDFVEPRLANEIVLWNFDDAFI